MTDIRYLQIDYDSAPAEGDLIRFDGTNWVPVSGLAEVGDIKIRLGAATPSGYLPLAGGSIGNTGSGATVRANPDTEDLFVHLWTDLTNTEAPVSGGRGASGAADFAAGKRLTLPDARQRLILGKAASGTGSTLGSTGGNIDHTHSVPAHHHAMGTGADLNISSSGSHNHDIQRNGNEANNGGAGGIFGLQANTGTNVSTTQSAAHTHSSGNIAGRIGLVTGGVDGNAAMTSGSANPPFIVMNFFIKY